MGRSRSCAADPNPTEATTPTGVKLQNGMAPLDALITHMEENGLATVELTLNGEERWMEIVADLAEQTML